MKRRSFLKLTGGVCAPALLGSGSAWAKNNTGSGDDHVLLDRGKLSARNQNRSTVVASGGMVATSQPLASMAGVDVLKAGGNAVDAAVAANAMLSLVEPMSCGPGGDLFAILWSEREQKLFGLNASGRSPYDWSLDDARALGLRRIDPHSPLSWSVPGCVSGWETLLERFGSRGFAQVLEPAIEYGRAGFPVSPVIARGWSVNPDKDRQMASTFMPEGKRIRFGDVFKNPDLARFFEIIAAGGAETFYRGEIAERIVKFSKEQGGRLSMRDFNEHRDDWVDPVSANYQPLPASLTPTRPGRRPAPP